MSPTTPLISIIVPIYNVEKYLVECLDSILNQTYVYFEVILVNDGSPDKSPEIAQSYVDKDPRFNLLNKENGGLSSARNMGLRAAKGDYVLYVDSDDYIILDALEKFVNVIRQYGEKDLIHGNHVMFDDLSRKETYPYEFKIKTNEACKNLTGIDFLALNFPKEISCYSWLNLYKREFLIDNNLFFTEGIILEDMEIFYRLFFKIKSIGILDDYFYYYRIRENSIMTSKASLYKIRSNVYSIKTKFSHIQEINHPLIQQLLYREIYYCLITFYITYQKLEAKDKSVLNDFHAFRKQIPLSKLMYSSRAIRIQQIILLKAPSFLIPLAPFVSSLLIKCNALFRKKN